MTHSFSLRCHRVAVALALPLLSASYLTAQTAKGKSRELLDSSRQVHTEVVQLLESGKVNLDSPVADVYQGKKSVREIKQMTAYADDMSRSWNQSKPVTVQDLLADSEETMKLYGVKVHLEIRAKPSACSASYRPYVGGLLVDAGMTDTTAHVDPKYYLVTCLCHGKSLAHMIDATSDTEFTFDCEP